MLIMFAYLLFGLLLDVTLIDLWVWLGCWILLLFGGFVGLLLVIVCLFLIWMFGLLDSLLCWRLLLCTPVSCFVAWLIVWFTLVLMFVDVGFLLLTLGWVCYFVLLAFVCIELTGVWMCWLWFPVVSYLLVCVDWFVGFGCWVCLLFVLLLDGLVDVTCFVCLLERLVVFVWWFI